VKNKSFRQLISFLQKTNDEWCAESLKFDKEEFDLGTMNREKIYQLAYEEGVISAIRRLMLATEEDFKK
jgi:hypothetical protein